MIEELSAAERRTELERMLGGEEFLTAIAVRARAVTEVVGTARLGRRTKDLVKRLRPGDLAIIDHVDLDRVSAEELVESGVRAVVNVSPSSSGRFPNPGPLELVRAGVCLVDATRAPTCSTQVVDGETVTVRSGGAVAQRDPARRGRRAHRGARSRGALADQQSRVTEALEAFADNTLRHLRDEGKLLADGIDFPPLTDAVPRPPRRRRRARARATRATSGSCGPTSGTSSRSSSRSTVARTRCSRSA